MRCTDVLSPKYRVEQIAIGGHFLYIATNGLKGHPFGRSLRDADGYSTLERILEARRDETLRDLKQRLQDARAEWTWSKEVRDTAESSELDGREDIELGLIQLKIETLRRINEALSRLHHGTYGYCVNCRSRISKSRLRALPFAMRCTECEEPRECAARLARAAARRVPVSVIEVFDSRPRSDGRLE